MRETEAAIVRISEGNPFRLGAADAADAVPTETQYR